MVETQEPTPGWREMAQKVLPELESDLEEATEPLSFMTSMLVAFETAYEEPRDDDLIRRIYEFAEWCSLHGDRDRHPWLDVPYSVLEYFYRRVPTRKAARLDMPRWFDRRQVVEMRETFEPDLDPGEFESLLARFTSREKHKRQV